MRAFVGVAVLMIAGAGTGWARFAPVTCKNAFTQEQEQVEGQKVAAEVYKQMPVLPDSDPVSQYVQRIGAKLVGYAPGYRWPYNFHVVASEEINAFALPGGAVFVNLGTVRAAETEAQLAGVMAHEISHVVMRHSTCNITKQQSKKTLYGIGSVLSSVLLGNGALGSAAQLGLGVGQSLQFLKMSREDEQQADLLGTGILYDAGYDPRGLPQFFETIQAKYGAGGTQLLSDHPNPGNRTEYVNAEIQTLPARARGVVTTPEFARVHAIAMTEPVYAAKEVQAGVWKQTGRYAGGPGAASGSVMQASAPVGAKAGGTGGAVSAGGSNARRLDRAALGIDDRMVKFQGTRFVVNYPESWKRRVDPGGAVTLAPEGGVGAGGIVYGVLIDLEKQSGEGVTDAASLREATTALVQKLSQQNGGLEQVGERRELSLGGQPANAVELRGRSAISEGGTALPERDWLVTVERPDGDLNYVVCVSPEVDLAVLRPVFTAMVESFRAE